VTSGCHGRTVLAFLRLASTFPRFGRHDDLFTSNYVTLNVLDNPAPPGNDQRADLGAKDYAMRIWLKPDRLAQLKLRPTM
jgi:hypothetical protein